MKNREGSRQGVSDPSFCITVGTTNQAIFSFEN